MLRKILSLILWQHLLGTKYLCGDEQKIDLYFEENKLERIAMTCLLSELNRQESNLNQITKQLNSKPESLKQETNILIKELKKPLDNINQIKEEVVGNKKK